MSLKIVYYVAQLFYMSHVPPKSPVLMDVDLMDPGGLVTAFENMRLVAMSWRAQLESDAGNRMLRSVMEDLDRLSLDQNVPLI